MKIPPTDLRKRLFITIRGEEALDYGGVAKLALLLQLAATVIVTVLKILPISNWYRDIFVFIFCHFNYTFMSVCTVNVSNSVMLRWSYAQLT